MKNAQARNSMLGMTLIEILIVLALVAVAATGISFSTGAATRSRLRSACVRVLSASRFAYTRAISQQKTVRIAFDFQKNVFSIQESDGTVLLNQGDKNESETETSDPWAMARARLEGTFDPKPTPSPFHPIAGSDGKPIKRYASQKLGAKGLRFLRLLVPHSPIPIEGSNASGSIYFFPNGQTEHAVLQIGSESGNDVYSLELHPLTARGTIHAGKYVPTTALTLRNRTPKLRTIVMPLLCNFGHRLMLHKAFLF
ncbi:MAG: prepilin-type N-terminal cleavage/methylation domain-containing protein [Myxococcales bacterium]|nr:MAG: prepilin-type N-terminal cleavage/methylation domain-containing protein [Myxococcales bacterium]